MTRATSLSFALALFAALPLAACGGTTSQATDAGTPSPDGGTVTNPDASTPDDAGPAPDGPFVPAPHPAAPQVESYGGKVMTAPKVVPVFYANDPWQSQIEAFLTQLSTSEYWSATTKEYGVGPITVLPSIVLSDTAPAQIEDAQIQSYLSAQADGTHQGWPLADASTLYVMVYPQKTVVSQGGAQSCQEFGGYHFEAPLAGGGGNFPYAVIPRCPQSQTLTGIDVVTAALSHELVEAATDPFPQSDPAYAITDEPNLVWAMMPGSETGDMCAYAPQSYSPLVSSFVVQRSWSNAAAKAGHDPCVPAPKEPYFNAAPILNDNVSIDFGQGQAPTKGVKIPVGQSKVIDVALFSDAPTGPWTVQAVDASRYQNGGQTTLTFSWDKQSGKNGDVLHLTVTRLKAGPIGGSTIMLLSSKDKQTQQMWFSFVAN
jgi:hypothetical protein